jgi:hypothetical protein
MEDQEKKFTKIIEEGKDEGKESLVDIEDQKHDGVLEEAIKHNRALAVLSKDLSEELEKVREKKLSSARALNNLRISSDPRDKMMEDNEDFNFQELTKREEEIEKLISDNMSKMRPSIKKYFKKPYED